MSINRFCQCLCANVVYVPRACVLEWFTCQRACAPVSFTCLRANVLKACKLLIFTCQRVNKCVNVEYGVPMFNLACQRAKRYANFLNIPLTKERLRGNLYTLLLYKKFYVTLDVIVIHIVCICIVHKNCIILHFYTSCLIKEKLLEFFFLIFYFFALWCEMKI